MSIPEIAVKRPITVLMITLAIILFGVISFFTLPVELMPDISYKMINISISLRGGGLPPEETEAMIIRPIEDAIGGVSNLDSITSTGEKERATVRLFFRPGTNMDFASMEVREAFAKVKNKMPSIAEKPVIGRYDENDKPIMILAVTSISEVHTPEEIRTIVDHEMKESLMRVSGVANVDVVGGRMQKVICNIDQKAIRAQKIPIRKIVNKIGVNTLNVQVGSQDESEYRKGIVLKSEYQTINEIKQTSIFSNKNTGTQILLKELATVKLDYMEAREIARLTDFKDKKKGGQTSNIVSIRVQKKNTANTVTTSTLTNKAIDEIEEILAVKYNDLRILRVSDDAIAITEAINTVKNALITGAIIAFGVLLIFLMNLRTTLIIGVSIPISMLMTFLIMKIFNIPINIYTLSGLALGAGMLVDSSICVLEHIFKKKTQGLGSLFASIEGANEMVLEICAGTLTTIVVFIPIFFVNEQIKMTFAGLAYTVIASLISSLIVAITILPAISARVHISSKVKNKNPKKGSFLKSSLSNKIKGSVASASKMEAQLLISQLKKFYLKSLSFCIRYRYLLMIVVILMFILSILHGLNLKQELTGGGESNSFTIFVELPDGAKLEVSDEVVAEIESLLRQKELFPEVESVTANVEGWSSKIYVNVIPKAERERPIKDIIEDLRKTIPTLKTVKKTDSFVYFSEDSQDTEEVSVNVFGHNNETLKELANKVAAKIEEVEGMVDAKLQTTEGRPEFWIIPKKYKAGEFGISTQEMSETIHAQLQGLRATAFHPKDGSGREIETLVRLEPKYIQSLNDVRNLTMMSPKGQLLYIKDIAFFDEGLSPSEIWRKDKSRMIGVSATSTKLSMEDAIHKVKKILKTVEFPKEYYYVFSGSYYKMLENKFQLKIALGVTIILIYMVLASLFESYSKPFIIMLTVPLALIGAVPALKLGNHSVTMGVFIGAIMLAGIVVNGAIILISTINDLRSKKGYNIHRAVLKGGLERTRPILMTSCTTIFGLYPLASDHSQFAHMWAPLAVTVMGGLTSATILTLFIIPGCYIILEDLSFLKIKFSNYIKSPLTPLKFLILFLTFLNIAFIAIAYYHFGLKDILNSFISLIW